MGSIELELAVVIFVANAIVALGVLAWCNYKIKELTDKDKRK